MITPFFYRWLLGAALLVSGFGAVLLLLPEFSYTFFNVWYLGNATPPEFTPVVKQYIQFVYGVLGAVMIGWGAGLFAIVRSAFRRGERWAWLAIAGSLAIWFVPDTLHSLLSGFASNAVLNLGFAVVFAVPLAATYRAFFSAAHSGNFGSFLDQAKT